MDKHLIFCYSYLMPEYGRDTTHYKFATPKDPTTVEDLYAKGFSKKHRHLADGRTVVIRYADSMRVGKDTRFNRANVLMMTEMYQLVPGEKGAPSTIRRLPAEEFIAARREIEQEYKSAHLGAEDLAHGATGREVNRTIRRRSAG